MYLEQKYLLLISSQLGQFKKKDNNLFNFRCPYCGDSQKSKSKARGYVFQKENSLIYKCHNCGVGTNVPKLIKHVNETLYNEFMTEAYRAEIPQDPARGIRIDEEELSPTVKNLLKSSSSKLRSLKKVSQLDHDHPVKKFVEDRKIPSDKHYLLYFAPHFYKFVNTIIDNKFPSLTGDHPRLVIPFFNENNELIAIQGRAFGNENPKYITIKIDENQEKIYGTDRVDWDRTVCGVEGPIDSLFIDNCLATAQSDLRVYKDNVVLIPDNEPRNLEIVKQIEKYINENFQVVIWPSDIKQKDINEMILSGKTERNIKDIIAQNTFSGLLARTKLIEWKKV